MTVYKKPKIRLNEIDSFVNTNALYAYSLRRRAQSDVIGYLNDIVKNRSFIKEFKPSLGNTKKYLLKTQNPDEGWRNDLDTALTTASLINLDYNGGCHG